MQVMEDRVASEAGADRPVPYFLRSDNSGLSVVCPSMPSWQSMVWTLET